MNEYNNLDNQNMIRPAFTKTRTDEEKATDKSQVLALRLNTEEREMLDRAKIVLEQPKDSTAIKDLFKIGLYNVLHDQKVSYILGTLFKNKRNNERTGIVEFK